MWVMTEFFYITVDWVVSGFVITLHRGGRGSKVGNCNDIMG